MTDSDRDAIRAADASTAPSTLADIANDRPDLRATVAANPSCPVDTLQWLGTLPDPAVAAALATNRTALAHGIARPAAPSPWAAPVPGAAPAALPDPTATAPSAPPTVPTPVTAAAAAAAVAAAATAAAPTEVVPTVPPAASPVAVPPTVTAPVAATDPTPTAMARPPVDPPRDERRRSGFGLVLVMIPLLFVGGCLAALALARGGDDSTGGSAAVRTTVVTDVLPTQETAPSVPTTAAPPPIDSSLPPAEAPTTPAATEPAPTDPPPTEPPTAAPAPPAPTVRAAATTIRPTATTVRAAAATTRASTPATTVVRAAAAPSTTVAASGSASSSYAYTLAQQFASALASGDWARARALSPSSSTSDANYQAQYGNLDASTVVPVRATAQTVTTFALRIGLVAHETNNGVKQTSLFCARWDVDTAAGTVTRVDGTKLRTENGTKAASSFTAELTRTCASVALD